MMAAQNEQASITRKETVMPISRSMGIAVSGATLALAAGYFALNGGAQQSSVHENHDAHAAHQAAGPAAAKPEAARTVRIAIAPDSAAPPAIYRFHKNDSIDFRVTVPHDGMLAIHGYTNDVPVAANREIALPLKLQHSGRFPMHVHAHDGEHIEVAVLEILPD
jgi:hypothetical protein